MRKLFISAAIVAGLILGEMSASANDTGMSQAGTGENLRVMPQLSGKVTNINSQSLMLRDQEGIIHQIIPAESSELAKIKVGDNVTVDIKDGIAVAINKTNNTDNSEAVHGSNPQNQEIEGRY